MASPKMPGGTAAMRADSQEAAFADRLRELMAIKCITQEELSRRAGCTQPAVSQMLGRKCRPQKKTILKLADALGVPPRDLWPDIEVAETLDAVADFAEDGRNMSEAEGEALRSTSTRNAPKIAVRPLPTRSR